MAEPATTVGRPMVGTDILPGDVVRELVGRHEDELAALADELTAVGLEADALEREVRAHPALDLLGPDEAAQLLAGVARTAAAPAATTAPRTTVVRRPAGDRPAAGDPVDVDARSSGPASGAPLTPVPDSTGPTTDATTPSVGSQIVTSHWVWKAGVGLTLVALLLLKFG